MSAPSSVFVTFHENGSPAVVSEYRDEAEAQNGQPATEYVTEASASHAAMINDRIQARMQAGLEQLIVEKDAAESELTRLRAALQAIADRQPHRPMSEEHPTDTGLARALARFDLAEMARAALVSR